MDCFSIAYRPIGIIHSQHRVPEQTPIQPIFASGCSGSVEVFEDYVDGLRDVEGFSHLFLVYHFHCVAEPKLLVKPFLQDVEHGVFATRAPCRPNPIGLSIVTLTGREGHILYLDGVDVLDGTPLLDIKPYTARFDNQTTTRNGWQDEVSEEAAQRLGRREFRGPEAR